LKGSPGPSTRPLISRARKSLFDILGQACPEGPWLDLFAGTGSVGLEALSRGAPRCDFVELDPRAARVIQENLERVDASDRGRVRIGDALELGPALCEANAYGTVFAGPPFGKRLAGDCLRRLDAAPVEGAPLLIVQYPKDEEMPARLDRFERVDERSYGEFSLGFWKPIGRDRFSGRVPPG